MNLIDTPGHVDSHYEVSRSLAACEGALLVVDAAQGVEAQTVANAEVAVAADLEIIPVINKIDLPTAEPDRVRREIEDIVGLPADDAILLSAKTGEGVDLLLQAIAERIPAPAGDSAAPLRALVFDSWYDPYLGATLLVRLVDGELANVGRIRFLASGDEHEITLLGELRPELYTVERAGRLSRCAMKSAAFPGVMRSPRRTGSSSSESASRSRETRRNFSTSTTPAQKERKAIT